MPIRLTAVGGPLDGQTFEYGKGKAAITLGRHEDRDIRFPADFRSISRTHLTIVVENDKYYLRPDQAVFVDGHQAMRDDELPRRCELRLGSPSGPAFKVEWNILSDMPSTQAPMSLPRVNPAREAMRATARTRKVAFASVGLVAVVAAAVLAYVLLQPKPIRDRLAEARPSVYMVMLRNEAGNERRFGTAWVIGPGLLATNAHIVTGVEDEAKKKGKAYVRANFPPYETHEITETIAHPHYDRFAKLVRQYAAVGPDGRLMGSALAYDVGLLRVSATARLAPPLKVAPTERLHSLTAGDEIGYVGYPSERMTAGGFNISAPTPQTHIATITAVTDFFLSETGVAERFLIQHSLPGTGGASGSPVFNRRGEVIGLFNAGNFLRIGDVRVPGVLVNFAQRVDLVTEIIDVKPETIALARDDAWKKRLSALPSAPEWLTRRFQRETNTAGAKALLDTEVTLEKRPNVNKPAALVDFEIPGPGKVLYVAFGEYPNSVHLYVLDGADKTKVLGRKTDNIHYPWITLPAAQAGKVTIAVLGDKVGLKIALRVYFAPGPQAKGPSWARRG
jgi:S1-C subfamily serine protease